jgi:hypothetical protein
VATFGYNCNGQAQSPYTPPPPAPPAPPTPTPDGYTQYQGVDSGGNDLFQMVSGTSVADLATACNNNISCVGFNVGGWLKSDLSPQNEWTSTPQSDLYVKNDRDCSTYGDNDTNLPDKCYAQMWIDAGCTTNVIDDTWWKTQTKAVAVNDIHLWATETDSLHTTACYGAAPTDNSAPASAAPASAAPASGPPANNAAPPPIIQSGSTVNVASVWNNGWNSINDGTWANSLGILNDGTIICTNGYGSIFVRANLSSNWNEIQQNTSTSITSGWNGKCIDQSHGNYDAGVQMQLWDCVDTPNQVMIYDYTNETITVPGGLVFDAQDAGTSDGTPVMQYPWWGGDNQKWTYGPDQTLRPHHAPNMCLDTIGWANNDGQQIGLWECNGASNQTWNINQPIPVKGVIQLSNGTYVGVGIDNNLYTKTSLTDSWYGPVVYGLMSVIQLNDGTLIGVGLNNTLLKSNNDIASGIPWREITCPQSCCVTFVSKLTNGTIIGIGTNGLVYTRDQLDSPWVLVDDTMTMSSVTQLKDGTILGTSQAGYLFSK